MLFRYHYFLPALRTLVVFISSVNFTTFARGHSAYENTPSVVSRFMLFRYHYFLPALRTLIVRSVNNFTTFARGHSAYQYKLSLVSLRNVSSSVSESTVLLSLSAMSQTLEKQPFYALLSWTMCSRNSIPQKYLPVDIFNESLRYCLDREIA